MTTVLKLGGSLVTEKDGREQVAEDRLASVAREIGRDRPDALVLVHGGGSFGHPAAAAHGVSSQEGTDDPRAVAAIGSAMERLNRAVVEALLGADVPAVSAATGSFAWMDGAGAVTVDAGAVCAWVDEGFVPVARGDVACRLTGGAAILSGDDLAVALAETLGADRLGLCADVPGVLDADGAVIEEITRYDAIADAIGAPQATDVTGGMGAKVRAILDSGVTGAVFGRAELPAFLAGELPGTRVAGDAGSF